LFGVAPRVVVARRAPGKAVRVARREVVLVQALGPIEQVGTGTVWDRQRAEQRRQIVAPGVRAERQVQGLARLLGRLLGSERGPFRVTLSRREPRMVKVVPSLA